MRSLLPTFLLAGAVLLAACNNPTPAPRPTATVAPLTSATAVIAGTATSTPIPLVPAELIGPAPERPLTNDDRTTFSTLNWKTNLKKRTVNLKEIVPAGPPRDGIPPIYSPQFWTIQEMQESEPWLVDRTPVAVASLNGETRAYPLGILIYHEVVNDKFGETPVAITYCPLCNTALGFKRTVNGKGLQFGPSWFMRNSNLVMWYRTTQSWWQQGTFEAIVGDAAGLKLEPIPVQLLSWGDFKKAFPEAKVLSIDTGSVEQIQYYGQNPYSRYDAPNKQPFAYTGAVDGRLPATERVVALEFNGKSLAFPYPVLRARGVVNYQDGDKSVAIFYKTGVASPVDADNIRDSKDVGTAAVFDPKVEGQRLTFMTNGQGGFVDGQTKSVWDITGKAVDGPMKGKQMALVLYDSPFWFSWAAFKPNTTVYTGA